MRGLAGRDQVQLFMRRDEVFRAIADLKDQLGVNVELAIPSHFIPELPGWESRSPFIAREGMATFHHYDLYSQALAKIERGHAQDRLDVETMIDRGLVDRARLRELFSEIEPQLYRYPALNPGKFKAAVLAVTEGTV